MGFLDEYVQALINDLNQVESSSVLGCYSWCLYPHPFCSELAKFSCNFVVLMFLALNSGVMHIFMAVEI